jgi:hypothetical protein
MKTKTPKNFVAPKVVSPDGFIWENARGGPYKYGKPMPATRENLAAAQDGLL